MEYVVATDGSEVSEAAIEHAAVQTSVWEGTLTIVHVLTPEARVVEGALVVPGGEEAITHGKRILEDAAETAATALERRAADVELETELLTGLPAEAIADYAEESDAEGIFVGHRGLSEDEGVGSVAKTVVDKATVPVTIIK